MPKLVVGDFPSAFHGLVEIRKIKKKFLPRLISLELQDRSDIPQPFAFGYRIYEEKETDYVVSISVVKKDELEKLLSEHPDAECVVTKEVAFAASLFGKVPEDEPYWCMIPEEGSIRLFLVHKRCLVYSTVIPLYSEELSEADLEMINSALRYAYNVVGSFPDRCFVTREKLDLFKDKDLAVTFEGVDFEEPPLELVQDYNLLPRDILAEKRAQRLVRFVNYAVLACLLLSLSASAFQLYRIYSLKRKIKVYSKTLDEEYRIYSELVKMRERVKKLQALYKERNSKLKSFYCVTTAYSLYNYLKGISFVKLNTLSFSNGMISVSGRISNTKNSSEAFLNFLSMLESLKNQGMSVVNRSFDSKGSFSFVIKCQS